MTADFTLYLDGPTILLRPEHATARKHLEQNVTEYAKWLVKFPRHDGSSFLLMKQNTDAFFVKPGCVLATLADTLGDGQGLAARHLKIQQKEWCAEFALVACRGEEDSASIWICSRLRPLYYPNQLPVMRSFITLAALLSPWFPRRLLRSRQKVSERVQLRAASSLPMSWITLLWSIR